MILKRIVQLLGLIAALCGLVPLLAINFWWINIFDYPLIEFTILTILSLILYLFTFDKRSAIDYIFIGVLTSVLVLQVVKIFPYSRLGEKQLGDSSKNAPAKIKIFEANVLQKNNSAKELLEQIKTDDPDILLFTETSKRWQRTIDSGIGVKYKYKVQVPQDNTYGMLLYSKFELKDSKVNYRVQGKIPSINTLFLLPDGTEVRLYAIHPTPPDPEHKSSSSDRGLEMIKTALTLIDEERPIVVLGDFNEVAWSQNVSLFQEISGLLDVRKGRGFYNTFDANLFFMRWPLDQVFTSEEFRVETIKTWGFMGSDHFPFSATLTFEPLRGNEQKPHPVSEKVLRVLEKHVDEEDSKRGKNTLEIF